MERCNTATRSSQLDSTLVPYGFRFIVQKGGAWSDIF